MSDLKGYNHSHVALGFFLRSWHIITKGILIWKSELNNWNINPNVWETLSLLRNHSVAAFKSNMKQISNPLGSGLQIWICCAVLLLIISSAQGCYFPDYAQNNVSGSADVRDWRGKIRDQNKKTNLR